VFGEPEVLGLLRPAGYSSEEDSLRVTTFTDSLPREGDTETKQTCDSLLITIFLILERFPVVIQATNKVKRGNGTE
jgi:hypothetical protein